MKSLTDDLTELLLEFNCAKIVVVCIGTDAALGDCLAPLVGQKLIEFNAPCYVYGHLNAPINAKNYASYRDFILKKHKGAVILAIDACVGKGAGNINIAKRGVFPASSLSKPLNAIGDISILGTTCSHSPSTQQFLTVRLRLVEFMAQKIAKTILNSIYIYNFITNIRNLQPQTPQNNIRL